MSITLCVFPGFKTKRMSVRELEAFLAFIALMVALTGCNDIGGAPGDIALPIPLRGTRYDYLAYDSTGTPIVRGWLTLILHGDSVSGEWHFNPVGTPTNIGPQIGDGNHLGTVRNGKLIVELQPMYRDNNLSLVGTLSASTYAGEWTWISFIGPTNHGTFVAQQH
jgi:hypothetical protein